ncbi:hypothetical protein QC762_0098530 [Podospora pseudocomata]|uniref:Heterokaryon incompatibility domain-containing protein n=1 Tax=Podospora pseudocomata TaxID=2093779 RepID=A0ABR0G8C8_9PEZI|nr:hypothetical protein QC762_0098530 [Podospora pseudocomata]
MVSPKPLVDDGPKTQCDQFLALLLSTHRPRPHRQHHILWEAAITHATKQDCSLCKILTGALQVWFTPSQLGGVQLQVMLIMQQSSEKQDRLLIQFRTPARVTPWTEGQTVNFFVDDGLCGTGGWNLMKTPAALNKESFAWERKVEKMKAWLGRCRESHEMCRSYGAVMLPEGVTVLPSRVLDLLPGNGGVRLYESRVGERGRYACLSHRWGKCQPLTTTRATLGDWKEGLAWEKIPKLFQDAIDIARELGVRYLWIDSLCIVQDDAEDWYRESRKMCAIYQNAVVTVAGTAGFGCEDSLVPTRERTVAGTLKDGTGYRFEVRLMDKHLSGSPSHVHFGKTLLGRGWVYQERLLSRRIIHCCSDELVWECMESVECECPEGVGWMTTADRSRLEIKAIQTRLPREAPVSEQRRVWHDIVRAYTALDLTKISDRAVAILGLAVEIQHSRKGLYAAGLWEDSFLCDLAWHTGTATRRGKRPTDPRPNRDTTKAPTWSWLSVSTCCEYWSRSDLGNGEPWWEDSGTVVEKIELPPYHTLSAAAQGLGLVHVIPATNLKVDGGTSRLTTHGCLTLKGNLLAGTSSQSVHNDTLEWSGWFQRSFGIDLNLQESRARGFLDIQTTNEKPIIRQGQAVFGMPLGTSIDTEGILDPIYRYRYLLLLVLVDADEQLYERVGMIELAHGDYQWKAPAWWDIPFEAGTMTTMKII